MAFPSDLPPIISFAIVKGGAGKTSLVCNIAGVLARSGWRTLIVTLDPQDNVGEDLGYTHRGESDDGAVLVDALLHGQPLRPSLTNVRPDLDVICAGPLLDAARRELILRDIPTTALAEALHPLATEYDIVLLDCPPSGGDLQRQALAASHWLVTPTQADLSSRKGIRDLASEFVAAREVNPDLTYAAAVLFDLPANATRRQAEAREFIEKALADLAPVTHAFVRSAKSVGVAARDKGMLVRELADQAAAPDAPKWWQVRRGEARDTGIPSAAGNVARDYEAITTELLDIIAPA